MSTICIPVVKGNLPTDVITLPGAAAIAYRRVFCSQRNSIRPPSNDELDLVALALSLHLPIYGIRDPGGKPSRISEPELLEGMFWGGAARFESRRRPGMLTQLTVGKTDLERILRELENERSRAWRAL